MSKKNSFKFVMPADLEKGADGSWKVRGLASTQGIDQQGETIIQKGIDLTPIDQKRGILNWDHKKGPENTIGTLDGYNMGQNGLYIEGNLFKNHDRAKAVKQIMDSLGDGDRGRMGLSVEGQILERDPSNPKIIKKCKISAVALTMNPVNSETYAGLVKSMSGNVEFDATEENVIEETEGEKMFTVSEMLNIVEKALGVSGGYTQAPNELTNGDAMATSDMKAPGKKKKKKEDEVIEKGRGPDKTPRKKRKNKENKEKKDNSDDIDLDRLLDFADQVVPKYSSRSNLADSPKVNMKDFKKSIKPGSKELYKSMMVNLMNELQVLYPYNTREDLWEAVKIRMNTKFPNVFKAEDE